jgi:hypothetical protein
MEATCSSETSTDFYRTTRLYIPKDRTHGRLQMSEQSFVSVYGVHSVRTDILTWICELKLIFIIKRGLVYEDVEVSFRITYKENVHIDQFSIA